VAFAAAVVEAGVEALECLRIVKPQDDISQQGNHLASAGPRKFFSVKVADDFF
jgi:hypothetical protein